MLFFYYKKSKSSVKSMKSFDKGNFMITFLTKQNTLYNNLTFHFSSLTSL